MNGNIQTDIQGEQLYSIEKIIGVYMGDADGPYYKVQWKPTWEPASNLQGCDALIKDYWKTQRLFFKDLNNESKQKNNSLTLSKKKKLSPNEKLISPKKNIKLSRRSTPGSFNIRSFQKLRSSQKKENETQSSDEEESQDTHLLTNLVDLNNNNVESSPSLDEKASHKVPLITSDNKSSSPLNTPLSSQSNDAVSHTNKMKKDWPESHSNGDSRRVETPKPKILKRLQATSDFVIDNLKDCRCAVCKAEFAEFMALRKHVTACHEFDANTDFYECVECRQTFSVFQDFEDHVDLHSSSKRQKKAFSSAKKNFPQLQPQKTEVNIACPLCPNSLFTCLTNLNKHLHTKHADCTEKILPGLEKLHKCPHCMHHLTNAAYLEAHIASKHENERGAHLNKKFDKDEKEQVPTQSTKKVDSRPTMADMENNFQPAGDSPMAYTPDGRGIPHQCPHCGTVVQRKKYLTTHVVKHFENNDFENIKKLPVNLSAVQNVDYPLQCSTCALGFSNKQALTRHLMSHSASASNPTKLHQCSHCNEKRKNLKSLLFHVQTRHPEKADNPKTGQENPATTVTTNSQTYTASKQRSKCTHCPSTFKADKYLQEHLRQKHADKGGPMTLFQCKICKQAYRWRTNLNTHTRRKHPDAVPSQNVLQIDPPDDLKSVVLKEESVFVEDDEKPIAKDVIDHNGFNDTEVIRCELTTNGYQIQKESDILEKKKFFVHRAEEEEKEARKDKEEIEVKKRGLDELVMKQLLENSNIEMELDDDDDEEEYEDFTSAGTNFADVYKGIGLDEDDSASEGMVVVLDADD